MHLEDIRDYVVRPVLAHIGLREVWREQIVIGTGDVESEYNWLDQSTPGIGPAFGFWQMERATHDDIWKNWLAYQPMAFRNAVFQIAGVTYRPDATMMHWHLGYAALMCALAYRRARGAAPERGDFEAMAAYWKQYYNTPLGKGTIAKAIPYFKRACEL